MSRSLVAWRLWRRSRTAYDASHGGEVPTDVVAHGANGDGSGGWFVTCNAVCRCVGCRLTVGYVRSRFPSAKEAENLLDCGHTRIPHLAQWLAPSDVHWLITAPDA